MKKYLVKISETATQDLENIAGSMPILDENLTGHAFMDWEKYLKDEQ